jgi:hypothetical protein
VSRVSLVLAGLWGDALPPQPPLPVDKPARTQTPVVTPASVAASASASISAPPPSPEAEGLRHSWDVIARDALAVDDLAGYAEGFLTAADQLRYDVLLQLIQTLPAQESALHLLPPALAQRLRADLSTAALRPSPTPNQSS